MSGRQLFSFVCGVVAVVACLVGAGYWALQQAPDFYAQAMQQTIPPVKRREAAEQFVEQTKKLVDEIKFAERWNQEFTEQQINGWLAEELHQHHQEWVPRGVRDPRVRLNENMVQIGFHLTQKKWNGIVSLRVKPWMVGPNQLAVSIESAQAGLLPVPLDEVVQNVAKNLAKEGWQIEWVKEDGVQIAIVDLDAGRKSQPVLETVEVLEGLFRVSGRQPDSGGRGIRFEAPRVAAGHNRLNFGG